MFDMAYIQEEGNGRLMLESRLVREHCERLGQPVTLYTPKRIYRRQLALTRQSFVFGDIDSTHGAMQQIGISIPEANYYPAALQPYLHRKVWRDTLGNIHRHTGLGAWTTGRWCLRGGMRRFSRYQSCGDHCERLERRARAVRI